MINYFDLFTIVFSINKYYYKLKFVFIERGNSIRSNSIEVIPLVRGQIGIFLVEFALFLMFIIKYREKRSVK